MTAWQCASLGSLLTPSRDSVWIDPQREYTLITVRLHGQGVVLRGRVLGSEIAADRRRCVRAGQLLVARIDARNGAMGIVPPFLDGAVVSNDFIPYEVVRARLSPEYLGWMIRSTEFVKQCALASEGTTNRVRLSEQRFLEISVPLPPLDDQERIGTYLNDVARRVQQMKDLALLSKERQALVEMAALSVPQPTAPGSTVGDFASVQSGYALRSDEMAGEGIRLVRNINVGHGCLRWSNVAYLPELLRPSYHRFELHEGDILVSLDRPLVSTGLKAARVRSCDLPALLVQRVGRFEIKSAELDPGYLYAWLRSPAFAAAISPGRSNGIPHISPLDILQIPFAPPPLGEQQRLVVRLEQGRLLWERLRLRREQLTQALDELLPQLIPVATGWV